MVRIRSSPSKMFHEKTDLDVVDTGRTLNVQKTFGRRAGRTFNLRSVYGETFRKIHRKAPVMEDYFQLSCWSRSITLLKITPVTGASIATVILNCNSKLIVNTGVVNYGQIFCSSLLPDRSKRNGTAENDFLLSSTTSASCKTDHCKSKHIKQRHLIIAGQYLTYYYLTFLAVVKFFTLILLFKFLPKF